MDLPAVERVGGKSGDDLVEVRVGRGPRTGLVGVDGKLRVVLAVGDRLGGGRDGRREVAVEQPQAAVRFGRGPLDEAHRPEESPRKRLPGDGKVVDGALRRGAVQRPVGDLDRAHRIVFDTAWRNRTRAPAGRHAHSVDEVLRAPDASVGR